MKKYLMMFIFVFIAIGTSYAKPAKKEGIIIGFSNSSNSNSWRAFMLANFWAETDLHPEIGKVYYESAEDKPYKQVKDIQGMLKKGIDALIVSPAVQDAVNPAIDKAFDMGIPVIIFDRKVTTKKYTTFIEASNYDMGKFQAEWLVKELKGKGNIVMFSGIKNAGPAMVRLQGARDVLKKNRGIKILAHRYTNWSLDQSKAEMKKLVKRFPKIDGIWGDSGLMTWPALQVMKEAGRKLVPSTGDHLNGYAKFLVRNNIRGFIYPFTTTLSRNAVQNAIKAVKGEKIEKYILVQPKYYGPEEIKSLVKLDKPDFWWIGDDQMPEKFLPNM